MNNGDRRVGAIMTAAAFAFLTAAVTLVTQILVYRIVSAKFLNNYAFLVISLTMLGFAFSGVVLTRHLDGALRRINEAMTWFTALFIISLLSGTSLFYQVVAAGNYPASRMDFSLIILKTLPYVFVFLPPFAFAGLILGTLLFAPSYPTGRIYFSDLVGSGFGAFVVIPAISRLGLEECLLLTCALFVAGSLFCYRPKGAPSRIAMGAAIVLLVIATVKKEAFFKLRYPSNTMLSSVEELGEPYGIEYTAWDPIGRIEVSRIPPPHPDQTPYPSLIGSNREFHHQSKDPRGKLRGI